MVVDDAGPVNFAAQANPSMQLQAGAPIPSPVSFPIATLGAAAATIVVGDRGR
jgi:hypothetical protein